MSCLFLETRIPRVAGQVPTMATNAARAQGRSPAAHFRRAMSQESTSERRSLRCRSTSCAGSRSLLDLGHSRHGIPGIAGQGSKSMEAIHRRRLQKVNGPTTNIRTEGSCRRSGELCWKPISTGNGASDEHSQCNNLRSKAMDHMSYEEKDKYTRHKIRPDLV